MTIRPAYRELSYPLPIKGGDILRTIQDARAYMLTLGPHREMRNHWQYARQLITEEANVEVVTWQFHRALFMDGELDLMEFQRMNPRRRRMADIATRGATPCRRETPTTTIMTSSTRSSRTTRRSSASC